MHFLKIFTLFIRFEVNGVAMVVDIFCDLSSFLKQDFCKILNSHVDHNSTN